MSDAYAELYEHNDAGTPLLLGAPGVFSQWVSSVVGLAGPSDLLLPSAASDDITVGANGGGIYCAIMGLTFASDRNAAVHEMSLFVNGVEMSNISFHRTVSNPNTQGVGADPGLLSLSPGDVVDLRMNSTVNATTITFYHVSLVLFALVRNL